MTKFNPETDLEPGVSDMTGNSLEALMNDPSLSPSTKAICAAILHVGAAQFSTAISTKRIADQLSSGPMAVETVAEAFARTRG